MTLVWRSDVGANRPNELTRAGWEFLARYLGDATALVLARLGSVPPQLAGLPVSVIAPCVDSCRRCLIRRAGPAPRLGRDRIVLQLIVNALQTHADVVVKKSLEEGFGLGVTEAMCKRRAVVASGVGGHHEQIESDVSGVLISDPRDLPAVGAAIVDLLDDTSRARKLGAAARRCVRDRFLPDRHMNQWLELLAGLAINDASDR